MNSNSRNIIKNYAQKAIADELNSLKPLESFIDEDFAAVAELILQSGGRVVITGIGKSAIIAQKIVATLNSTGTPAIFMHAADAIHGDLGIIQEKDLVIAISKSGNTPEIKSLAPLLKRFGNTLVAMVGNVQSDLALMADFVINTTIDKEACPNNLAPTTSTTAQLIMGDALAVALLKMRNFTSEDFSKYHPGGALGKRLFLTTGEIAAKNAQPMVVPQTAIKEVILNITKSRLGATAVVENKLPVGIITDGDIRRMLEKHDQIGGLTAADIMSPAPKSVEYHILAAEALEWFHLHKISQLIITKNNEYAGMIHLHDLNREGIL